MKLTFTLLLFLAFCACGTKNSPHQSMTSPEIEAQETSINEEPLKRNAQNTEKARTADDKFEKLDFSAINTEIAGIEKALTPKEIMKIYYPAEVEGEEGNQLITLKERALDNGNIEVILIHDNQLDDAIQGTKYHMELTKQDDKWKVISLKNNWKCWEGRGHTDWSAEYCL